MFPLRDNIPARRFPVVNLTLIVVNVLVFAYQVTLGEAVVPFIMEYGFVPARFLARQTADPFDLGRFVPVLTSQFLHGNLLHIFSNMWMLWVFGDNVEDSMGRLPFLFFYLACGVAAVFVQTGFGPESQLPMVGASGSISGVLGAYFVLYPKARVLTFVPVFILFYLVEIPAVFFLGFWIFLQFLQGSFHWLMVETAGEGGVAWWAHIGGFAVGFLAAQLVRWRQRTSS